MNKIKDKFERVAEKYAGRILFHIHGDKCLAFTPLTMDVQSEVLCSCGHAVWNATNFGNLIHFCPNQVYEFEITKYQAVVD